MFRQTMPLDAAPNVLRGRRTRPIAGSVLAAVGIAVGSASMVCVVGTASSSRARFDQRLAQLWTSLLKVIPGETVLRDQTRLPTDAVAMVGRIPQVTTSATAADTPSATDYHLSTTNDQRLERRRLEPHNGADIPLVRRRRFS
jgi:putative ABC transport system permease protein